MDLLTNDQDPIDTNYWSHYFHLVDLLPFGDDTLFEWLDKQGKNNISVLEFPYPNHPTVEDLSLWDGFDNNFPLLCLKDDNTTQSHGSSVEAYSSSSSTTTIATSTTIIADPIVEDLSLWDCFDSNLPLLCFKDDNTTQSHGSSGKGFSSSSSTNTTSIATSTTIATIDPIVEDLSLWDCFDSNLPLLCFKDDNTTQSHGSSGEGYSSSSSTNTTSIATSTTIATIDPIVEVLSLWDCFNRCLPLLCFKDDNNTAQSHGSSVESYSSSTCTSIATSITTTATAKEFSYYDPVVEDLSLWDCFDSNLPLLCLKDDNTAHSHGSSVEAYISSTTTSTITTSTTTATVDHYDQSWWRKRVRPLEFEEIKKHFDKPIAVAAEELNVGLTVLKKRCRELNIKRWPHRKLKSLKWLIHTVKDLGLKEEVEMLERQKRMMEKQPEMELTVRTKKLRQTFFKESYKKRLKSSVL